MKQIKHCGICAYTKVWLENQIVYEQTEKDKMNQLQLVKLEVKHHSKMRAYQKALNEIKYIERKLKQ